MRTLGAVVVAVLSIAGAPLAQTPQTVLVFAAASMKGALDEVGAIVTQRTGVAMKVSYAATSTLAKQIEEGAPADIFVSADEQWMDYVAQRTLVAPASRVNVVSNRLVLIAPRDPKNPGKTPALAIAPGFALAAALGPGGRLAVADPASVPAGRYGKAALTALGVWPSVAARLAPADNVRAALAFVARGEAPLGIVYQSDVIAEPGVAIVGTFPESTHPRIVYPAALTVRARPGAKAVLDGMASAEARAVFVKHGFVAPGS
jgi:molybdate transport system substrate-binding protein